MTATYVDVSLPDRPLAKPKLPALSGRSTMFDYYPAGYLCLDTGAVSSSD